MFEKCFRPDLGYARVFVLHCAHSHIDDLVQDCSNSNALVMELLQSCTNTSMYQRKAKNFWRYLTYHLAKNYLESRPDTLYNTVA